MRVSVRPIASMTEMPKRCSNARCCSGGSGADAERAKRTSRHASRCAGVSDRAVQQIRDDRRHHVEPRRPIALDQRPPLRRAEAVRHHDAAAGHERAHGRDALAVDVIERQRRQHAVGARKRVRARPPPARRGACWRATAARLSAGRWCPTCTSASRAPARSTRGAVTACVVSRRASRRRSTIRTTVRTPVRAIASAQPTGELGRCEHDARARHARARNRAARPARAG